VDQTHEIVPFEMKSLRKDYILESNSVDSLFQKRDIQFNIAHPFLVSAEYIFESEVRLYYLTRHMEGGELYRLLTKHKRFQEEQVKYFALQIALALKHLHRHDYVCRDLRPENVLIDS
jgi:serine/threonine protein kinase